MGKVHKTIEEAGRHLGESVTYIPARYKEATAKADWETPTTSGQSEANYQAGLADAIAKDKRRAGVREAGNTKYRKGTAEKGTPVIAKRITDALGDYKTAFAPVLSAMCSAADAAPARTRDAMMNIDARLKPVVAAAQAAKK